MVDHIEPIDPVSNPVPRAHRGENLQSLCWSHHATKTAKETRGQE